MTQETLNKIWDRFIHNLTIHTFGEREVLMEGKKVRNFLGSAEAHRKLFMEAANEILVEEAIQKEA